ncbi:MAG: hypothetical protein KDC98_11680, partial [Planctomycetes bacterium]|nr:hypothetical protein [Planctomycetota bacterium]
LESHRNPGKAWRYQPRDKDNDLSLTTWCVMACMAGVHAGLEVRSETVSEALAWAEGVTTISSGHCGYTGRGQTSARMAGDFQARFPPEATAALTAAGMNMRALAGLSHGGALDKAAAELVLQKPPTFASKAVEAYYWFHGSEAMAALPDRAASRRWFAALDPVLLGAQRDKGSERGSWDPSGPWGTCGGRVYSTAMAVLALSSRYRLGTGDLAMVLPDEEPFRGVFRQWRGGKIGAALEELDAIDAATLTPPQLAVVARARRCARVQLHACERITLDQNTLYPDAMERQQRLEELAESYADTAPGKELAASLARMLDDPRMRAEITAAKKLESITGKLDKSRLPTSKGKRSSLRKSLEKLIKAYPETEAAKAAGGWLVLLK